jgi:hypothetical protein
MCVNDIWLCVIRDLYHDIRIIPQKEVVAKVNNTVIKGDVEIYEFDPESKNIATGVNVFVGLNNVFVTFDPVANQMHIQVKNLESGEVYFTRKYGE